MAMSYDDDNNSILLLAAMNRITHLFGEVLTRIEKYLSPQEVRTTNGPLGVIRHVLEGRMHL